MENANLENIPGYQVLKSGIYAPVQIKADAISDLRNPSAWLHNWSYSGVTHSGVNVSHHSVMGLSTYYACIRAISEDLGKTPMIVFKRSSETAKDRAPGHKYYQMLHDFPNEEMESLTFRETLTSHALAWGNGYAEIARDARGEAIALYPIHPSRVVIRRDENGKIVYDVFGTDMIQGQSISRVDRLRAENMLHIRGLGAEGLYGYSILQVARESLGLSIAAQTYGAAFFANGAHISGVLEHPGNLTDIALTHLRDSWQELYSGANNSGKPAILEEGMKYTKIGIPPDEAQYLETRNFQVREVARWFRMPLHKVQDLADASFNNIEHQSLDYLTDTLTPWIVRWEQQIKRKLFHDDPEHFAEFFLLGLLRSDTRSRSNFYRVMLSLGALSPNEIRSAENMNPIGPEGDLYYIASNNLTPINTVLQQTEPAPPDTTLLPRQVPNIPTAPLPTQRNGAHKE